MLPLQFFGQNLNFALNLFVSLVFFAIFWLYFDAAVGKKRDPKEFFKYLGFLLLAVSFLIRATTIEQSLFDKSLFGDFSEIGSVIIRLLGYLSIVYAQIIDPIQKEPTLEGLNLPKNRAALLVLPNIKFSLPLGSLLIALLYYRRATKGLEKHLKQIAFAFFFLSLADSLSLATLLRNSVNVNVSSFTSAFGPVWVVEQALLLIAAILFGKWVWGYLLKRLLNQLFMIFTTGVLLITLLVSISFTFLLISNIQSESLRSLEKAAKVLTYSLESKKAEVGSVAEIYSQNREIIEAVVAKDHAKIAGLVGSSLENKKISSLVITSSSGVVLLRADEPDRWGDSISSDSVIKRTLQGAETSNLVTKESVLAPIVYIQASKPLIKDTKIVGSVLVNLAISNNFLDNIKKSTGLDSAMYAGNVRSATTLLALNGKDRWVGVKEESEQVKKEVLQKGRVFKGSLNVLNRPFLVVYQPLKNLNNEVVAMAFTGEPQVSILRDSGKSIELIFLLSSLLLLLSVLPSYFISKYIARQLH